MEDTTNIPVTPEQAAEGTAPTQSAFAPPSKKRSPKLVIGGIIAGALVLFGGISAVAYTQWYQNDDKVVHDAILHAVQAKAMATTGTVVYEDKDTKVTVELDGKGNDTAGEFNVKADISINNTDMKHDLTVNGSGRMVNDTLYVKLGGIKTFVADMGRESATDVPSYLTTIVEKIDDKWISIKPSDYTDVDEQLAGQQECFMNLSKKIESDAGMRKEVTKLYRDNQIVTVEESLGSKNVNGTGSLGYIIAFDTDATATFVKDLKDTALGKELRECNDEIDFDKIAEDLTKEAADTTNPVPTIELWASRFGHKITELTVRGDTENNGTMQMVFQPTFNGQVTVDEPQDAISLKTLMDDIQSSITNYYMDMYSSGSSSFMIDDTDLDFSI